MGLEIHQALKGGKDVLLEGAQGTALDVDHGTYPYVTSSITTAGGASSGAGIGPTAIDEVLGVMKAYITRVGNGPLPTAFPPDMDEKVRQLGAEFGATTGRPRRCGWFDGVLGRYSARGERPHGAGHHQTGRPGHPPGDLHRHGVQDAPGRRGRVPRGTRAPGFRGAHPGDLPWMEQIHL